MVRKNTMRSGVYIANFQTADKLSVESFPLPSGPPPTAATLPSLATAVITALLYPGECLSRKGSWINAQLLGRGKPC